MRRAFGSAGILGCALGLLSAAHARADQPGIDAGPPPRVEALTVHGQRADGLSFSLPMGGEEVPATRIARLPATNAAGIVGNLPGIRVQQRVQGEDAAVSIDGLPPEYSKLLLNGLRYAGEIGAVGDLADLPIAGVDRIEVLRGPQALLYGSDAAGGVVNVVTRAAPADPGARFQFDGRAGDQGLIHSTHSGAARIGNLGATWNLLHDQIDGYERHGTDAVAASAGPGSRERTEDVYSTFDYSLGETTRLLSDVGWRFERDDLTIARGVPRERRDYTRSLASFGAEHTTAGGTLARAQMRFFGGNTDSDVGRPFDMREREWSLDSELERDVDLFGAAHSFELGFDAELPTLDLDEDGLSQDALPPDAEDVNENILRGTSRDKRFAIAGLSTRWQAPLTDWAELDVGLRSQLHSEFADRVLPQAALRITPADALSLRLAWGLGYRTPSLRELYQPPVAQNGVAYFLQGNPDLKPESSSGVRLGLEYQALDRVQFAATLFSNRIDDHIRSVPVPGGLYTRTDVVHLEPDPTNPFCQIPGRCPDTERVRVYTPLYRKANLDLVRTRGIEAQMLLQPAEWASLRVGYTLMHTSLKSANLLGADELPNEPPHTLDLESTLRLPGYDTELTLRARWRDEAIPERSGTGLSSFQDPDARTDRSWVVDLRMRQPLGERLELYLDATNLTNQKSVDSYQIRPRLLAAGVTLSFEDLQ